MITDSIKKLLVSSNIECDLDDWKLWKRNAREKIDQIKTNPRAHRIFQLHHADKRSNEGQATTDDGKLNSATHHTWTEKTDQKLEAANQLEKEPPNLDYSRSHINSREFDKTKIKKNRKKSPAQTSPRRRNNRATQKTETKRSTSTEKSPPPSTTPDHTAKETSRRRDKHLTQITKRKSRKTNPNRSDQMRSRDR